MNIHTRSILLINLYEEILNMMLKW